MSGNRQRNNNAFEDFATVLGAGLGGALLGGFAAYIDSEVTRDNNRERSNRTRTLENVMAGAVAGAVVGCGIGALGASVRGAIGGRESEVLSDNDRSQLSWRYSNSSSEGNSDNDQKAFDCQTVEVAPVQTYDGTDDNQPCALSVTQQSSLKQFRSYSADYVEINKSKMKLAKNIVQLVKEQFVEHMKSSKYPTSQQLEHTGSTYEGLKVIKPDEFDLMIPIRLEKGLWECVPQVPGYWTVRRKDSKVESKWGEFVNDNNLNPVKLMRKFQSILQHMGNSSNSSEKLHIKLVNHGPAIQLHVTHLECELDIDMVPLIVFGDIRLVAKPHPEDSYMMYDLFWRQSFSEEEKAKINGVEVDRKQCLKVVKIMKAIRLNNSQLRMLTSYHLKTVLLHMLDDSKYEDKWVWHQDNLVANIRNFLEEIREYAVQGRMPSRFNKEINLFQNYSAISLKNLHEYLSKLLKLSETKLAEQLLKRNY